MTTLSKQTLAYYSSLATKREEKKMFVNMQLESLKNRELQTKTLQTYRKYIRQIAKFSNKTLVREAAALLEECHNHLTKMYGGLSLIQKDIEKL